jgi:hypothetical protein
MAAFDDGTGPALYVGGSFIQAGNVITRSIARWNGTTWSAVGFGMDTGFVEDLLVFDDGTGPALYAGGSFHVAGGVPVSGIAKWDGTSWSDLGGGITFSGPSYVESLGVFFDELGGGPVLHAGGFFTEIGGVPASYFARWNGSSWAQLGGGVSSGVYCMVEFDAGSGPALYAGGQEGFIAFDSGDQSMARWQGCVDTTPPVLACPTAVHAAEPFGSSPGEVVHFTVTASDEVDPAPELVCVPPSGSFFPPGTTLVHCTATDHAGNQATCDFPVSVEVKLRRRQR